MKRQYKKLLNIIETGILISSTLLNMSCIGAEQEQPDNYLVCTVNGENIYNLDFTKMQAYYLQMFQQAGYDMEDSDVIEYITECSYETYVETILLRQRMTQEGYYDFTEEEEEAFSETGKENYQEYLDYYTEYYQNLYNETQDATYSDAILCATNYLIGMGITEETLAEELKENAANDKLEQSLMANVSYSEEDIEAYYEDLVEKDKELYENDIASYEYAKYYTTVTVWYIPDGFREVMQIALDTEDEELKTKEEEIYAQIDQGTEFTDLIAQYSVQEDGQTSYTVSQDSIMWADEMVAAIFSDEMQEPGDVSSPVTLGDKVHIFYYVGDVQSGAVELTEENKDELKQDMEDSKLDENRQEYVEEAKNASEIEAVAKVSLTAALPAEEQEEMETEVAS